MADPGQPELAVPEYREIKTERLQLRTASVADAEGLFPIVSNPDVMQWTSLLALTNLEEARGWLTKRTLGKDVFNFTIHTDDSQYVGIIGTFTLPAVGYLIHPSHAGKGYATEALQALVALLFGALPNASHGGWDYVEGVTDRLNGGSRRVLEKCGFVLCEERSQDFNSPSLGIRDTCIYRIARPGVSLQELGLQPSQAKDDKTKFEPQIS